MFGLTGVRKAASENKRNFLFTCTHDVHLPCQQRIHTNFTTNLLHDIYIYYVYCV